MSCVYEPEPVSFPCILETLRDFRNGEVTSTTIRKVLKQVDSAVAAFGKPRPMVNAVADEDVPARLEESLSMGSYATPEVGTIPVWVPLLLQFLQLLLK